MGIALESITIVFLNEMEEEIIQYELQLTQVQLAIAELPEGSEEKQNLTALEADLKELISLSRGNLKRPEDESSSNFDPLLEEYNLFKAELAEIDSSSEKQSKNACDKNEGAKLGGCGGLIVNKLDDLQGKKCQAPFKYKWSNDVIYHNAFICNVPATNEASKPEDIKVIVMFMNPTHEEMLPCPYYLEGSCKFSDDKCRYSHGESVLLSALKEYREPVFSKLSAGSQIFAKQDDGLWHRAVVIDVNDFDCLVKFQLNFKEENVALHNIYPLEDGKELNEGNDLDLKEDNSDSDNESFNFNLNDNEDAIKRILDNPPGSVLGEWEKFTKGFGSKIMAKMGYIHGSGLGRDGLGRVEPVPAVILPPGKSLDHCMMLKSKAGNDKDLFKAEKKMKKLQKKHEEKLKKAYEMEKKKSNVFTFLNTTLHHKKNDSCNRIEVKKPLKNESTRNLNITSLQLSEDIRKAKKEIEHLHESLARHSPNSQAFNVIKGKLATKKNALFEMHESQRKIKNEQNQRRDREKLTVF